MLSRQNLKLGIVAAFCLLLAWTGPSIAHGVHAQFAHNAHKVDGKHAVGAGASKFRARNKLVAHNNKGQLPAKFIPKSFVKKKNPLVFKNEVESPRIQSVNGTDKVFAEVSFNTPSNCGSDTRHRYLIEGTAWVRALGGDAVLRMSLVPDGSNISFGPGFSITTQPSGAYGQLASQRLVHLEPGAHTVRFVGDAFTGSGEFGDANLTVTDLGYHCNGGPTPRVAAAPNGGSPAGS